MSREIHHRSLRGELVLLGTGTSVGVPMIGCRCPVCSSEDPRNARTRCAVILGLPHGNLLIDTPPDLRMQLLREEIGLVHAVAYTHEHADHIFGLDDLRLFQFYIGGPVPLYCAPPVEERIRKAYDYAFEPPRNSHAGSTPALEIRSIGTEPFQVLGSLITPMRLEHGSQFEVLGFRVGNVAYCTDTNGIPPESRALLQNLDVLILDALRASPHATHFSLEEAVEVAQELGARQVYFTHVGHELDYEKTNEFLPDGMQLAHDGLRIPLS